MNVILDLDNTIISSLTKKEMEKGRYNEITEELEHFHKDNIKKIENMKMDGEYTVFIRPHLDVFLDYLFENFEVSVWTAASENYAKFIIENIILRGNRSDKKLKEFLHSKHCDKSQKKYSKKSPKDLRYLFNENDYKQDFSNCNTVIIDDLYEVNRVNSTNTLRADVFDAFYVEAQYDTYLLCCLGALEAVKRQYKEHECTRIQDDPSKQTSKPQRTPRHNPKSKRPSK